MSDHVFFVFSPILVLFWAHFSPVLVLFWSCFGPVLVLFWSCFGHVSFMFRSCFCTVLVLFRSYFALSSVFRYNEIFLTEADCLAESIIEIIFSLLTGFKFSYKLSHVKHRNTNCLVVNSVFFIKFRFSKKATDKISQSICNFVSIKAMKIFFFQMLWPSSELYQCFFLNIAMHRSKRSRIIFVETMNFKTMNNS